MRRWKREEGWRVLIGFVVCVVASSCAVRTPAPTPLPDGAVQAPQSRLMTINGGDVLEVIIRRGAGEERLTATVRDNGVVSVSFVDVQVGGLTTLEAEARLTEVLAPYVKEPRVQVIFQQKVVLDRFYVFGEVNTPGVYPLTPGMTVVDAIGQADGYTEQAHLASARVLRGNLVQPQILAANLEQLLFAGDFGQNVRLKDQDIVYVPRTRIGDWNQFLEKIRPTLEIIALPLQSVILYKTIGQ